MKSAAKYPKETFPATQGLQSENPWGKIYTAGLVNEAEEKLIKEKQYYAGWLRRINCSFEHKKKVFS